MRRTGLGSWGYPRASVNTRSRSVHALPAFSRAAACSALHARSSVTKKGGIESRRFARCVLAGPNRNPRTTPPACVDTSSFRTRCTFWVTRSSPASRSDIPPAQPAVLRRPHRAVQTEQDGELVLLADQRLDQALGLLGRQELGLLLRHMRRVHAVDRVDRDQPPLHRSPHRRVEDSVDVTHGLRTQRAAWFHGSRSRAITAAGRRCAVGAASAIRCPSAPPRSRSTTRRGARGGNRARPTPAART